MSYSRILKRGISLVLVGSLVACRPPSNNGTWALVKLVSMHAPIDNVVSETVEVNNCIVPEIKTTDCSAGTSNSLSVSLGGGIEFGEGFSGSIDSSVSSSLGIGQQSGQSISLASPPSGYIYTYEVDKRYTVINGEVLARSSNGEEQVANYVFNASCSITIISREQANCSDGEPPTYAPNPTNSPPTEQPTIAPSPPFGPTTEPDTVLEVGQAWRQGGLELAMVKSGWGAGWAGEGGGVYSFMLTNLESYDQSFRLSTENFSAVDNFGNSVPIIPLQNITIDEYCPPQIVQLSANQTIDLVNMLGCPAPDYGTLAQAFGLSPRIDAGDPSITGITVLVSVSDISNARWRIRIH